MNSLYAAVGILMPILLTARKTTESTEIKDAESFTNNNTKVVCILVGTVEEGSRKLAGADAGGALPTPATAPGATTVPAASTGKPADKSSAAGIVEFAGIVMFGMVPLASFVSVLGVVVYIGAGYGDF